MDELKPKVLSRSEREALVKDKAGWVITVLAALLAVNTLLSGANSSKILNNTIEANNTWAFYQAKSIKQSLAELALDNTKDPRKVEDLTLKINRYESDPATGEGKKELMQKARNLEEERVVAKSRSPYYTYAGSILQISIVLLTAAILAVSMPLFWGSLVVGTLGALLMSQAFWLFL